MTFTRTGVTRPVPSQVIFCVSIGQPGYVFRTVSSYSCSIAHQMCPIHQLSSSAVEKSFSRHHKSLTLRSFSHWPLFHLPVDLTVLCKLWLLTVLPTLLIIVLLFLCWSHDDDDEQLGLLLMPLWWLTDAMPYPGFDGGRMIWSWWSHTFTGKVTARECLSL